MVNYFTAAGERHCFKESNNQDAVMYRENERYCVIALTDGVSSCKYAREGAALACESAAEHLIENAERFFAMGARQTTEALISRILRRLQSAADAISAPVEEFSSTLACVLADKESGKLLYLNIGDSLIMAVRGEECYVVAMPADSRNGCYVTTTWNAAQSARCGMIDTQQISSVMICSDGAWKLMYKRSRLQSSVREMILDQQFDRLKEALRQFQRPDDCSFITMDLSSIARRKPI